MRAAAPISAASVAPVAPSPSSAAATAASNPAAPSSSGASALSGSIVQTHSLQLRQSFDAFLQSFNAMLEASAASGAGGSTPPSSASADPSRVYQRYLGVEVACDALEVYLRQCGTKLRLEAEECAGFGPLPLPASSSVSAALSSSAARQGLSPMQAHFRAQYEVQRRLTAQGPHDGASSLATPATAVHTPISSAHQVHTPTSAHAQVHTPTSSSAHGAVHTPSDMLMLDASGGTEANRSSTPAALGSSASSSSLLASSPSTPPLSAPHLSSLVAGLSPHSSSSPSPHPVGVLTPGSASSPSVSAPATQIGAADGGAMDTPNIIVTPSGSQEQEKEMIGSDAGLTPSIADAPAPMDI